MDSYSLFRGGETEQFRDIELLDAVLVGAYRGKPYEEVRTREVEDGHITQGDKDYPHPYPHRAPKETHSYVELRVNAKWDIVQDADGRFTLVFNIEDKTYSIPINSGLRLETKHDELRISSG